MNTQTPLSPLAGYSPVGEGTSGKVLNWTVRSLNHLHQISQEQNGAVGIEILIAQTKTLLKGPFNLRLQILPKWSC